ncbi:MAG: rod-binding protein [Tardiphaga sp.]
MTVAPVTNDLIADVLKAADPTVQRAATTRLERMAPGAADFASTIADEFAAGRASPTANSGIAGEGQVATTPVIRQSHGNNAVYRKFESFVLQMFVETMLPKDVEGVFGKGTAGNVWRSMLAEQIGNEMAKGDGVGIAKMLAKSRAASEQTPEG